ncbi:unnamed protein product [Moneuplotes crassus]|uniref:Uncharacterized protein n=1 Tax=Euplotes crassus TaxID=5936 RepID=A0AAD1UEL1_EUPCR|nr:unnamed protein product [Moneuplotes crassus]
MNKSQQGIPEQPKAHKIKMAKIQLKKFQIKDQKKDEIEQENRILFEKIRNIVIGKNRKMAKNSQYRSRKLAHSFMNPQRRAEKERIKKQNIIMLKRLQDTKSNYESLHTDQRHMKYLSGLGKKQRSRARNDKVDELANLRTEVNHTMIQNFPEKEKLEEAFNSDPFENSVYTRSNNHSSHEKLPKISSYANSRAESAISTYLEKKAIKRRKKSHVQHTVKGRENNILDPSRTIVFKKGVALASGFYIVEFSYTSSYFCISVFEMNTDKYYIKKTDLKETQLLFSMFNNDYQSIANAIQIKGDQIFVNKSKPSPKKDSQVLEPSESLSVILESSGSRKKKSISRNAKLNPYHSCGWE